MVVNIVSRIKERTKLEDTSEQDTQVNISS
jgi:hypothetical protein